MGNGLKPTSGLADMRALRIITAAVLIAGAAYLTFGFWAPAPAKFLIRTDPLDSADLIVVLAGDGSGRRVEEGLRLLEAGLAPRMLVNGSYSLYEARECDLGRAYAIARGGDPESIEASCMDAGSTLEESRLLDQKLRSRHVQHAIIVTSDFHTRRAGRIFRGATSGDVRYSFAASSTPDFDPGSWWRSRAGREIVVIEWIKSINSWLELPD
jgi:uncharacterized SAM-binding protein YcdF (DUF218 family)